MINSVIAKIEIMVMGCHITHISILSCNISIDWFNYPNKYKYFFDPCNEYIDTY